MKAPHEIGRRPIARTLVYQAIDGEIEYAVGRWKKSSDEAGLTYREDATKKVEEWLIFLSGYYQDAICAASHEAGYSGALNVVRKLAALCVRCMETNGAVYRPDRDCNPHISRVTAETDRKTIYQVIDGERDYQDALPPSRTDYSEKTVLGYLVMFDTYLRRAIDGWTLNPDNAEALDNIRKLAGIAVHCMEKHGAPRRQPVQVTDVNSEKPYVPQKLTASMGITSVEVEEAVVAQQLMDVGLTLAEARGAIRCARGLYIEYTSSLEAIARINAMRVMGRNLHDVAEYRAAKVATDILDFLKQCGLNG